MLERLQLAIDMEGIIQIPCPLSLVMLPLCFRLIFIFDKATEEFVADVLDPGILDVKLAKKGRELMGRTWREPKSSLRNLTFRDMHGRSLRFAPGSLHRPYRRALNFQARQARKGALECGWRNASWDFEDFMSEGLDVSEKMEMWLAS